MMNSETRRRLLMTTLLTATASLNTPALAREGQSTAAASSPQQQASTQPQQAAVPADSAARAAVQDQAATDVASTPSADIVVTGTLIRNPNLVASSFVSVINDAEVTLRAPGTVEEILRSLPGVTPGIGTAVNNGANGINQVDLRGLGVQRNLVLLDGNRIAPSASTGTTDLNVLPLALLQNVQVLTGGASTTYGADAVTGVVNFVTRKDFTGLDLRSVIRFPQNGQGRTIRTDLTVGGRFADDKGNAVVSVGYTTIDPVYQTQGFSTFGVSSTTGRASGASFTSVPTTISFPSGDNLQVGPDNATLVPQYQGFNFNPYNTFQTPLTRKSVYAAANYDIADGIDVYARGLFSDSTIASIVAPSGVFGSELSVPANNPYLTAAERTQICAEDSIAPAACTGNTSLDLPGVYRRTVELGPRTRSFEQYYYDARAGVRFQVTKSINLELSGAYGRADLSQRDSGYALISKVQQALNADNTATCTVTTGGCVPLNLFGQAGSITPAQAAFISGVATVRRINDLSQVKAIATGDFGLTVPFASNPISFAIGGEHRHYSTQQLPDALAQNPGELGGFGSAVLPFTGGYGVDEAYGELVVPIANGRPFFQDLTFETGVRYSSYQISAAGNPHFSATTYKGGLTWQPIDSVRLRGNYQHAVRAPNIGELFTPGTVGNTNLTVDPCAGIAPTTNANLAAICVAQGAPAGTIGHINNPSGAQAEIYASGNPNLKPEKADTVTVGFVVTPRDLLPGFNFSVDYYRVIINNAITAPTPGDLVNACFGNITAASASSLACTVIRRNPANGGLSGSPANTQGLYGPTGNAGRLQADGVDLTANWQHRFGEVGLNLNFTGNWTDHQNFQASATSFNRNCAGYYSANCGPDLGQIQPKYTFNQRTTVTIGDFDLSLLWRYIDPVDYEGSATDYLARGFTAANRNLFSGTITNAAGVSSALAGQTGNFNHIPAYNYFDLTGQFNVLKTYQLTVGVQNLFNRQPPIVGAQAGTTFANTGNTFPSTYDSLGRIFSVSVRVKL